MDFPLVARTVDPDPTGEVNRLKEETYGLIYWANTVIGGVAPLIVDQTTRQVLVVLQHRLFKATHDIVDQSANLKRDDVQTLNRLNREMSEEIPELHGVILPGGTPVASRLQEASAILMQSRRLLARISRVCPVNGHIAEFLDQASDFLFNLSRIHNLHRQMAETPTGSPPWPTSAFNSAGRRVGYC